MSYKQYVIQEVAVGSRVTCSPPPTDTDQDFLILCKKGDWEKICASVELGGFYTESYIEDAKGVQENAFISYKNNSKVNLIITCDEGFFRKFLIATKIAKVLNLLKKEDRIKLFQLILYGNS